MSFKRIHITQADFEALPKHPPGYYPSPTPWGMWRTLGHYVLPDHSRTWLIGIYPREVNDIEGVDVIATFRARATLWVLPVIRLQTRAYPPQWFADAYDKLKQDPHA